MASARPYRGALPTQVVLDHIQEGAGTAFDPEMVTALMELAKRGALPEGAEAGVAIHG